MSYSEPLTTESCKKVKYIIKDHHYQWLFPNVKIAKDCDTSNFFKTTEQGEYFSTGITGGVTGRGVGNTKKNMFRPSGFLGIDDPLKAIDWNSVVTRNGVNDAFKDALPSRFNLSRKFYVLSMQRLHREDLCGYLDSNFPSAYKRKLILPALIKGLPLCNENCSSKFLKDMENENIDTFSSQYMQDPRQEGDILFDVNKIQTIYIEPRKDLIFHSFIVADTSMVNKPTADFTVFGHFYVYVVDNWRDYWDEGGRHFFNKHMIVKLLLREIYVTRIDAANLPVNFEGFVDERLTGSIVPPQKIYIETKSSGIALHQHMQMLQQYGGKYNTSGFSLQELGKENLNKELRFAQVSPYVKNEQFEIYGNRIHINHHSTDSYIRNHLSNITRTKNSSVKDDIADVITYGLANTFLRVMSDEKKDLGQLSYDVINKLTRRIQQERQYGRY
ncbi:MAG: Klebsiella phage [Pseudomonadota bacterium]